MIWEGGEPADFELTLKFKMTPGDTKKFTNSGIQFRSKVHDPEKRIVGGYQADFEYGDTFSGILYEERGRGILALGRTGGLAIAGGKERQRPAGAVDVLVHRACEEYRFLHDNAVVWHGDTLFAAWYNCPSGEIVGSSSIRGGVPAMAERRGRKWR